MGGRETEVSGWEEQAQGQNQWAEVKAETHSRIREGTCWKLNTQTHPVVQTYRLVWRQI